ncbi:MAG: type II toxin-antitoxin system VapC family toxin [Deltaproteobacteria bacterium]|nr:type II toxin-antitoxin system VapC family toxin [Deltaproteobacteria bacterium]NCP04136.1 type II toxin-antitoxin system VapC family toxin [Deltaproteobacteria bacterium]NCP78647.1 type II toxin-antitoxin system VapC family toxin [Desulfuromonadales bacterium]
MIVLDTHVWLWWLHDPAKLSSAAVELVEQEQESGALILSAISIWEVAVKVQSGKLALPMEISRWYELARSYPATVIEPLSPVDAIASTQLPGDFHKDPADRMIISLARRLSVPLITCDRKILEYKHVLTVW